MEQDRTAEEVWAECNKVGEHAVRSQLLRNLLEPEYRTHAISWLANVDREEDRSFQAEQLEMVRSTRAAAETAARLAHSANRNAKRATVVGLIALVIATAAITAWAIKLLA